VNRLIDIVARRCRWLAIAAIVSAAIPLYFVSQIKIDNSIEVWLHSDSPEYKTYRDFLDRFESEEFIVIATEMDNPFSDEAIALQQELSAELKEVEGVARVLDLPGICGMIWGDKRLWKEQTQDNTFLNNLLLSQDGRTIGMFVWLKRFENPLQRRETVEAIELAVNQFDKSGFQLHLAGTPLMNVELDRGSQKASTLFLPVALGISVLVLAIMLRSVSGVIAPMCAVGVTTAWTIGIMGMTGRTMNMVTVVLPSLLFILSLSSGIHITSRFFATFAQIGDRSSTVRTVLRELVRPIFLSSITTSVGFASLMISDMKPVADFGQFASIGMLLSFLFNLAIVPGVLSLLHARVVRVKSRAKPHWSSRTGAIIANRRWLVCTVTAILLAVCVFASTKSKVESNVLKFFPDDSKISQDYSFIGNKLTGFYTVELECKTDWINEDEALESTQILADTISNRKEVARVIHHGGISDLLGSIDTEELGIFKIGSMVKQFERLVGKYRLEDDDMISLRMSVLVNAMDASNFYKLLDFIRTQADKTLGPQIKYNITGVVPLLNDVQKSLIDTQIRSFSIAATIILIMIAIFMRSVRAALASIIPNLLPVFAMFAFMVLFGIVLDAATVMIASVAIGIAADDTIHFLSHYRRQKAEGLPAVEAVATTFSKIGRAIVFTSIVSAAGFSILYLAQFKPIAYFGILTAVTMLMAMADDLFVLPAFVRICKPWEKR
jgi:predicted RND superfamily exporter protein